MDAFRDRFFGAFGRGSGREGLVAVVAALPRDATVGGERVERADVSHELGAGPGTPPWTPRACRAAARPAGRPRCRPARGTRRRHPETAPRADRRPARTRPACRPRSTRPGPPDGAGVLDLLGIGGEEPGETVAGHSVGNRLVEIAEQRFVGHAPMLAQPAGLTATIRPGRSSVGRMARASSISSTPSATSPDETLEHAFVVAPKASTATAARSRPSTLSRSRLIDLHPTGQHRRRHLRRRAPRSGRPRLRIGTTAASRSPPRPATVPASTPRFLSRRRLGGDEVLVGVRRSDAALGRDWRHQPGYGLVEPVAMPASTTRRATRPLTTPRAATAGTSAAVRRAEPRSSAATASPSPAPTAPTPRRPTRTC